jgi:hypothetical protein
MASNGNWYPQRWETYFIYYTNETLKGLIDGVAPLVTSYGEQGWETVSTSIERTQVGQSRTPGVARSFTNQMDWYFEYSIVCTVKRPVPPG